MSRSITYRDAINEALVQEMSRDNSVFIYGIDVADHKRTFGTGNDLVEKFGSSRCFSTPLSEDSMTGFGLGAAINGMRPIHVHMRVDFMLLAVNQLFNMVSSFRYGSGGKSNAPIVIRAIVGRGWGQAYQHSKSIQSIFAHIPGLKVVMPATPHEAKGLLISAIRDDDPVIVIEHRWLYDAEGIVSEDEFTVPLSGCSVLREGKDITVVATSWMNVEAMKAAEILSRQGVEVEVINAYSISDFDISVVSDSLKKTRHCIIADNDWLYCGFSSEIAAQIAENCIGCLESTVSRLGFKHVPCPCTRPLEQEFYPNAIDIIRLAEKKLSISSIDLSGESFYSYENKFRGPF
jgi:acetoin:2,6-dichlorophenolindophenol oxidoreductase subunit beta